MKLMGEAYCKRDKSQNFYYVCTNISHYFYASTLIQLQSFSYSSFTNLKLKNYPSLPFLILILTKLNYCLKVCLELTCLIKLQKNE